MSSHTSIRRLSTTARSLSGFKAPTKGPNGETIIPYLPAGFRSQLNGGISSEVPKAPKKPLKMTPNGETILPYNPGRPANLAAELYRLIPETAMTANGLTNALYRDIKQSKTRIRNSKKVLKKHEEARDANSKHIVWGEHYVPVSDGTVLAEAERVLMLNGSASNKAKENMGAKVKEIVKATPLPKLVGADKAPAIEAKKPEGKKQEGKKA
ncbi:hypothetical protein BZA77DRAFT_16837 [Pyronema omphalodes]|nr:hypothetical protein BZA77DRAFT_16837 [Pyronema omphalodes]